MSTTSRRPVRSAAHSAYPNYRSTGVQWLPEIPVHWQVRRLGTFAKVQLSNVDKHTVEGEQPVRLCNYVDVYRNERITSRGNFMSASASPEQVRRFALRKHDVLITKDSESWTDIAVPALVEEDLPGVLCGYHLAQIRPGPDCFGPYLARAFSDIGTRSQFHTAANGVTRFGLGDESIRTAVFPLPPVAEQGAIVAFLDGETARIDALIAKQERIVDLLDERRAPFISKLVTQGVDAGAALAATGAHFFPVAPKHWKARKLRRLLTRVKRPIATDPAAEYREIGIRSWGRGIFHKDPVRGALLEEKDIFLIEPGDFVLNIIFAWEGAVAVASEDERGMVASHRFPTFRPTAELDRDYLLLALRSEQGRALMAINSPGAAGRNRTIRLDQFLDEALPLPPLMEQQQIVAAFKSEEAKFQDVIGRMETARRLLKEWRTAIISAAVTGKIDVRKEAR